MGHFHLLPHFLFSLFGHLRNFHVLHVLLVPSHAWNQFSLQTAGPTKEIYRQSPNGRAAQQFARWKWGWKWHHLPVSSATAQRNKVKLYYRVAVVRIPTLDLFVTAQVLVAIVWREPLLILMLRHLGDLRIRPIWSPVNFKLLIPTIHCALGNYSLLSFRI